MRWKEELSRLLSGSAGALDAPEPGLLAIDVGCGSAKKPDTLGVDKLGAPGVDHVVDLDRDPLPFEDDTVGYAFSSHCIEHVDDPERMLREITRVCADGARIEIWAPYAWHNTAVFFDHKTSWTHEFYMHVGVHFRQHWFDRLGAWWTIDEFVYVVEPPVQARLRRHGFPIPFAVEHLHNVVTELGVRATIRKSDADAGPVRPPPRHYAACRAEADHKRYPLDGGLTTQLTRWSRRTFSALGRG